MARLQRCALVNTHPHPSASLTPSPAHAGEDEVSFSPTNDIELLEGGQARWAKFRRGLWELRLTGVQCLSAGLALLDFLPEHFGVEGTHHAQERAHSQTAARRCRDRGNHRPHLDYWNTGAAGSVHRTLGQSERNLAGRSALVSSKSEPFAGVNVKLVASLGRPDFLVLGLIMHDKRVVGSMPSNSILSDCSRSS